MYRFPFLFFLHPAFIRCLLINIGLPYCVFIWWKFKCDLKSTKSRNLLTVVDGLLLLLLTGRNESSMFTVSSLILFCAERVIMMILRREVWWYFSHWSDKNWGTLKLWSFRIHSFLINVPYPAWILLWSRSSRDF